jgi:hypothetical protein
MDASCIRPWVALFAAMVAANSGACDDADGAVQVLREKTMPAIACTAAVKSRVEFDMTQPGTRPENEPACPEPPALGQPVDAFEPNELAWLFA